MPSTPWLRMIPPVPRIPSFAAAAICALAVVSSESPASAHDLEHTQVTIAFARDGSFTVDVSNDPQWLALRLASIGGPFADRIVLWVDGHEVRPASTEVMTSDGVSTHRMR